MKRCSAGVTATVDLAYGNARPSLTEHSTEHPQDRYDTAVSIRDPRTTEILKQLQAKMAEMEKIVGEVGGLVTQLAGEEDEATVRAVERTRMAFQRLRSRKSDRVSDL
ncbi:MAG: hypothetical protein JNM83_14475 [Myxococcales bacterium]|nr:hypothetical protein [Myxococcales bacterium]